MTINFDGGAAAFDTESNIKVPTLASESCGRPPQFGPTSQTHVLYSHTHFYHPSPTTLLVVRQPFASAIVMSMSTGSKQLVVEVQVKSAFELDLEDSRRLRRTLIVNDNVKKRVNEPAAPDNLKPIATNRIDNPLVDTDLRTVDLAPTFGPNLRALVALTEVKIDYTISVPVRLNLDAGNAEAIEAYAISDYDAAATGSGMGKSFTTALSESELPPSLAVVSITSSNDPDFEVEQKESRANPILTIEVRLSSCLPTNVILLVMCRR